MRISHFESQSIKTANDISMQTCLQTSTNSVNFHVDTFLSVVFDGQSTSVCTCPTYRRRDTIHGRIAWSYLPYEAMDPLPKFYRPFQTSSVDDRIRACGDQWES